MSAIPSIKLNTGASIPAIGLGAFSSEPNVADSQKWFLTAFQAGYRHIDTAQIYGEHYGALRRRRRTRLGSTARGHFCDDEASVAPYQVCCALVRRQFAQLGFGLRRSAAGYDAPSTVAGLVSDAKIVDSPTFNETWAEMERLPTSRARAIGVSNFSIKTLEQLLKTAKIVPAVNQVEMSPYLAQTELLDYCREKGIVVTAYSPSGHEKVRNDPTIVALATKYGVTPTQIILAWHVARGVSAIPKSANPDRQKENLNLPALSAEDVARITALDRNERIVHPIGPDGKLLGWTAEQY
ncbi:reductase AKOR2, partial [Mycena latifolia]